METVFVLLMMTVGLSHGIEIHCDARQNGTQCYGAVNGTVSLRLVEKIETGLEYRLAICAKSTDGCINEEVFIFKKERFRPKDKYQSRSSFDDSSGTFDMRDITRSDEAQYVLQIFDSSGNALQTLSISLHLFVQAAVSPPKMSSECLSQGQMSVSCSCQGDSVRYNWTLNGELLMDKHLFSGHLDTQNITLTQALSGVLACGVNNRVSSYITVEDIKPCPGKLIECTLSNGTHIPQRWVSDNDSLCATTATTPVTAIASGKETDMTSSQTTLNSNRSTSLTNREHPQFFKYTAHIAASLAALLILLVVAGGIYCSEKKKKKKTEKSTGADAEDVTYADHRLVQSADTRVRRAERQVDSGADAEDVTYADYRLVQNADTRVRRAEPERQVEYGEVKGSKVGGSGGQHNADSTEEDSIYAIVRV